MKILLAYPNWDNRWIPYFTKELSGYETVHIKTDNTTLNTLWDESRKADVLISMWADQIPTFWSTYFPDKKIIVYCRRYEFYQKQFMQATNWGNVDALIFVNSVLMEAFKTMQTNGKPKTIWYIPNAIDLDQFKLSEKDDVVPKTKIAFVASTAENKNWGLASEILFMLPKQYTIHHIGKVVDYQIALWDTYLASMGLTDRWVWHKRVPASEMPAWYGDKDFILSTSVSEGNPNNVLEGMACGLRPVVHAWPGASGQFPSYCVFKTAAEAVRMMAGYNRPLNPTAFREWVKHYYSLENITRIHEVIKDIIK